jgi:hypothetical protein
VEGGLEELVEGEKVKVKGVRRSVERMIGKEAVEKTKRSSGMEVGE